MISYYRYNVLLLFKHSGFLQGREREKWENLLKMQVFPPTEDFNPEFRDLQTHMRGVPLTHSLQGWFSSFTPLNQTLPQNRVTLHTANIQPATRTRPKNKITYTSAHSYWWLEHVDHSLIKGLGRPLRIGGKRKRVWTRFTDEPDLM